MPQQRITDVSKSLWEFKTKRIMKINLDYKLTDEDFDKIAEKVIQKQSDEVFMKKVIETSEKTAEKKYWHFFTERHSEFEINDLLYKHLSGLVKNAMKEQNLLQIEIQKVLSRDELQKLGAKRLRDIACQLEREAELYENDQ